MRLPYFLAWVALAVGACAPPAYEIVVVGGTVIDGAGSAGFRAEVAIRGDRIVAVFRSGVERAGARAGHPRRTHKPRAARLRNGEGFLAIKPIH